MTRRKQSPPTAWLWIARRNAAASRREFGALISGARKYCRISWSQVAAYSGVDEKRLQGIADGTLDPTLTEASKIADALNVGFSIVLAGGPVWDDRPKKRSATATAASRKRKLNGRP
jgi:transcriptional regulator with XRE-family HTH domain